MEDREQYTIGETASLTGFTAKTLRYYDSLGLIVPESRNKQNNYRYYSKKQIIDLLALKRLRDMGCNIKALRTVVESSDLRSLYEQIQLRFVELHQEILDREKILLENTDFSDRLKEAIDLQGDGLDISYESFLADTCAIEEIPVCYLFAEERTIPNYNVMETSVNFRVDLYNKCRSMGFELVGPEVTTYYTEPLGQFITQNCKVRIGIEVENKVGCAHICTFGGFLAATAIHIGTYATMANSHIKLIRWINSHGYEVAGEVSERFMMSPINILDECEQTIKIIIPIRKISHH